MRKLLIFVDWFLPGYKAGGQIQSCANLTSALAKNLDIYVVTSDRDLGDEQPYEAIKYNEWNVLQGGIRVMYLPPSNLKYAYIKSTIAGLRPDIIYLNSMFSLHFTLKVIIAVTANRAIKSKLILAPRGMLHDGALKFKKTKKLLFLKIFNLLGFANKITFHATDTKELADIKWHFGKGVNIVHVPDFPSFKLHEFVEATKEPGVLRLLFVSRISQKKNLLFALKVLHRVKASVFLTVAGPIELEEYWSECMQAISSLPANIRVKYVGPIPNDSLHSLFVDSHVFILPTYGENFGHVIFESLASGRPVLISDQTPWRHLPAERAGWDLSLSNPSSFQGIIEECALMNSEQINEWCKGAWQFCKKYIDSSDIKQQYLQLFNQDVYSRS